VLGDTHKSLVDTGSVLARRALCFVYVNTSVHGVVFIAAPSTATLPHQPGHHAVFAMINKRMKENGFFFNGCHSN